MAEVTAVLPVRNDRRNLVKSLKALRAGSLVPEVIIVDDGSEDGTADMIKEEWPSAVVLSVQAHTGFAHAANAGLRLVRTDYAFLLRPGLQPGRHCLQRLMEAVRDKTSPSVSAGRTFCSVPVIYSGKSGSSSLFHGRGETVSEIIAAPDGCALYRVKTLEEIGWYDERHFDGLEAFDLSLRAARFGYRTVRVPSAAVRSLCSGDISSPEIFRRQVAAGNSRYVFYKNLPALQRFLSAPLLGLMTAVQAGSFVKKGELPEYRMAVQRSRALRSLERERRRALEEGVSVYAENLPDASFLGMNEKTEAIYPLFLAGRVPFEPGQLPACIRIQGLLVRDLREILRFLH